MLFSPAACSISHPLCSSWHCILFHPLHSIPVAFVVQLLLLCCSWHLKYLHLPLLSPTSMCAHTSESSSFHILTAPPSPSSLASAPFMTMPMPSSGQWLPTSLHLVSLPEHILNPVHLHPSDGTRCVLYRAHRQKLALANLSFQFGMAKFNK